MKVNGTQKIEIEMTPEDLGRALLRYVAEKVGVKDDAGCDWLTSRTARTTYIGGVDWGVSWQESIAALVDAANILMCGRSLHVMPDEEKGEPSA